MSVADFKPLITGAIARYFPQAKYNLEERRGVELHGRVQIDDNALIDVYFSAVTGKTSYALVRTGKRVFGYDNFRGWHQHPIENPQGHVECQEPSPEQVFREMKEILGRE